MALLEQEGLRLSYWDKGRGRALLFVHGVGTSGELWAEDLAALSDDCRLVVYDRRGYGASGDSPRDWEAHCDDAIALIEALGAAPVVLVGYSGGSIVALDLALRRPELVAGVVLLDPAFNVKRCLTPRLVRTLLSAKALERLRGPRAGAARWMRYVGSYPDGGSAFDRASPERRERLLSNSEAIFADLGSGGGEHIDESRLAEIGVPVTIVDAALSPLFLRRSCRRLRRLMPQARSVTLERSGHHIGLDSPDELREILRGAVAESAGLAA